MASWRARRSVLSRRRGAPRLTHFTECQRFRVVVEVRRQDEPPGPGVPMEKLIAVGTSPTGSVKGAWTEVPIHRCRSRGRL